MAEEQMQNLSFSPEDLAGQERKAKRQDQAAAFASWLNSMSIRPDPNLPAQLQAARASRVEDLRKNRTVNMLEQAGQTELANLVKAGTLDAKSAASQMFQMAAQERQFEQQKELAALKSTDTALIKNAIAAGFKPNTPEFRQFIASGGDMFSQESVLLQNLPKPEKGLRYNFIKDESNKIIDVELVPLKGGKQEVELAQEANARLARMKGEATSGAVVLEEIDRALEMINDNPRLTTGFVGSILRDYGGTKAKSLNELTKTIKASIGFDRLQRMRDESPTGGALGQVAVQELESLQATLGSFDTGLESEVLIENLERLEKKYKDSMTLIYNAALEDQKKGVINKKTGQVVSPYDYFTQGEINSFLGTGTAATATGLTTITTQSGDYTIKEKQ